jgi:hypothetical protein
VDAELNRVSVIVGMLTWGGVKKRKLGIAKRLELSVGLEHYLALCQINISWLADVSHP